ncbi:hypothetical protein ABIB48_000137 [Arthrobacter sp. UYCu511]|uniref:DUF4192 domain-containing protein n=1 Tax=Arthrobacter sp. UYCu511 TaxID=3156337 RepID=UPI00339B9A59
MNKPLETIKVSAGEDLLAFIPHMVGYWPDASIVAISMLGKKLRATMRLDLPPDSTSGKEVGRFAAIAATQLANDKGADGSLIAIFGRQDWRVPGGLPQAQLYKALRKAFEAQGLPVRDAWFIGTEHWRSLECTDARCCPWPGKENLCIKESFVNAEFIFRGSVVGRAPMEQVRELIAVRDPEFAASVAAAGVVGGEILAGSMVINGCGVQQLTATLQAWAFSLELWPKPPDPHMCAFLLAGLANHSARDAVMVLLATTAEYALAGAAGMSLVGPDTEPIMVAKNWYGGNQAAGRPLNVDCLSDDHLVEAAYNFSNILIGASEPRIPGEEPRVLDWARLDKAERFLQFLAQASDDTDKAPVLCILGWIQWCKGRGSWAGQYFQACMDYQPGYRLASLLEQLLSAGHVAECARNPKTAWHRDNQDKETDLDEAA